MTQTGGIGLAGQIAYGSGQVAGQVFRDLPSLLLLFFMTNVLGIAPVIAGSAIFVPKLVWGVLCDMVVGIQSDRLRKRVPRHWWLLAGALASPVAMYLLFHVPAGGTVTRVAYLAVAFSLYMAVFATFSVPYLAIASELTTTPQQRTVLMAWRLVFTAGGVLVSGALAPAIVQSHGGGQDAYEFMARVLAVICPVALLITFFGVNRFVRAGTPAADASPQTTLKPREAAELISSRRFAPLFYANLMQLAGSGMAYASMLYFLTYNMARPDAFQLVGVIVFVMCAGIILAQPMWVRLAASVGKKPAYVMATLCYSIMYLTWGFSAHASNAVTFLIAFLVAVGNSGWALLGFSLLADLASQDQRRAGLYSAVWIASDKIGFAVGGTLLVGLVLSAFGFDAGRAVAGLPQSSSAMTGVMLAFAVSPALLNLLALLVFRRLPDPQAA
ncbi:MAG: MFS transporter [Steroidobacteraceae bacterium]